MKVKNKKGVLEDILSFTDDLGFLGNMEPNEMSLLPNCGKTS